MGYPVAWFEVQAKDVEKQQQFYAGLFDWQIDTDNQMGYGMVDNGEGIPGGIGGPRRGRPPTSRGTSRSRTPRST